MRKIKFLLPLLNQPKTLFGLTNKYHFETARVRNMIISFEEHDDL